MPLAAAVASDDLAAAILVGGQSRRMGENKALIRFEPDGPTVVETVLRTLRAITNDVVLVGADPVPYAALGPPHIPDMAPGIGALGGIHTALTSATSPHVLIVACDMPFLSVELLRYMAALPRDYDALVPMLDRPQPLHAIYARTCLPHIERNIAAENYRVTAWFDSATVRYINRDDMRRYDQDMLSCFNMNTGSDLAVAKQLRRMQGATAREAGL